MTELKTQEHEQSVIKTMQRGTRKNNQSSTESVTSSSEKVTNKVSVFVKENTKANPRV